MDKQIFQWNIYRDKSIEHVSCAMCFPKLSACLPENHDFLFSHDGITCLALQTFLKTWSMWSMPNALWNWPHGFPLIKEQKLSNMLSLWGCQHFERYFEPFQNWTQKGHVDRRTFLKDNPVPSSTLGKISWKNNGKQWEVQGFRPNHTWSILERIATFWHDWSSMSNLPFPKGYPQEVEVHGDTTPQSLDTKSLKNGSGYQRIKILVAIFSH